MFHFQFPTLQHTFHFAIPLHRQGVMGLMQDQQVTEVIKNYYEANSLMFFLIIK